jgi:cytochrome c551/c552
LRFLPLLSASLWAADDLSTQAINVLSKNCFACHGAAMQMSGLDLRTHASAMKGGSHGAAIEPGNPDRSGLFLFASHQRNPSMPPGKKLADSEIDVLRRWIIAGATYPAASLSKQDAEARAALAAMEERPITPEERNFWSFRPLSRPAPPPNGEANPVDAFLRAEWAKRGLRPSPEADRRTLVRRAYLDLLGLPPTPEQTRQFLDDKSPKAWDNLVERLLASPHYGERWARHWLDLVRFADSGGFEYDNDRPSAWRYRDYVVAAFNNDKPYADFIREQIAGDEYRGDAEGHIATGFLRLGAENNIKNETTRQDELDDIASTTSQAFLGMTLGCARCHNHKFDPIPQKDYYRIQAVFFSIKPASHPLADPEEVARHTAEMKRIDSLQEPLRKRKTAIEKPHREKYFEEKLASLPAYMREAWNTPADKRTEGQKLNARQLERTFNLPEAELVARMPAVDQAEHKANAAAMKDLDNQRPRMYASAMSIAEQGRDPLPSYFLHRGSTGSKGSLMEPGVLSVASLREIPAIPPPPDAKTSYRRRNFAEWLASADNPLVPRVMANRIWQRHFGEGIVATPNNFGKTGAAPTHPELLDFLAAEFTKSGGSVKAMHRVMMKSKAYRMAADDIEANRAVDSANRYVWRMPRQRLDIETIRDNMMAVAGTLDATVGGPAVLPYIDPSLFASSSKRTWHGKPDTDKSTWRRSLYVFSKRTIRYPMFESFDQPDMVTSCGRRNTSVTAPQALLFMNNSMVRMHAGHFAERLRRDAGADAARQVERAFELGLARAPSPTERDRSITLVQSGPDGLLDFCQAIFNLNEFVYTP